ncbi:MAG: hypothetical protein LBD82_07610 [Deltaproteobacteria bacterium]|nr:hypothetical protein [Deltaproteobacteria bacterium]
MALATYLLLETKHLKKCLRAVPWRIHIYGTRGKSGLTRRVMDLLRHNGVNALGRTSGDRALLYYPDGLTREQRRLGAPNIREYIGCVRKAGALGCRALVMECMALAPENVLQAKKILSPTHLLLTNTRPDHHEVQGRLPEDIVRALALSLGTEQKNFALKDAGGDVLRAAAARSNAHLVMPEADDVPPDAQAGLLERHLARDLSLNLPERPPDNWPAFVRTRLADGGKVLFLDLFSANDVESSRLLLHKALERMARTDAPLAAVFNTRNDRPLRTRAFVEWFAAERIFTLYVLLGSHVPYALRAMRRRGLGPAQAYAWSVPPAEALLADICRKLGPAAAVVGLGNFHGRAEALRTALNGEPA